MSDEERDEAALAAMGIIRMPQEQLDRMASQAAWDEFQRTHKAFLVISGDLVGDNAKRDADGRLIGLTVAIQGEGDFVIPLVVDGDKREAAVSAEDIPEPKAQK